MQISLKDTLTLFINDISVDDISEENICAEEDDIDKLFQKLEPVELPTDVLEKTLSRIRNLPAELRYTGC